MSNRHARNEGLFGAIGQQRLRRAHVAVVGVGGLGTPVVQQLALLGVGKLILIEDEYLDTTNLNRYVGVEPDDVGQPKVSLAKRLATSIDPGLEVEEVHAELSRPAAAAALQQATHVFGCLDNDGARLLLTDFSSAHALPYIDLATDVVDGAYGGRVCVAWDGAGCLSCLGVLDPDAARRDLEDPTVTQDREQIYGVDRTRLAGSGPSVVSINGVVASLGVTEFMVAVTGLREPQRLLTYRAQLGPVSVNKDPPMPDCYYCKAIRGTKVTTAFDEALTGPRRRSAGP